jgi:hypothetical protein
LASSTAKHDHWQALIPHPCARPLSARLAAGTYGVTVANLLEQLERTARRVECPKHDRSNRTGTCKRAGVLGSMDKHSAVAVGTKLLDELPTDGPARLGDENPRLARLGAGVCGRRRAKGTRAH